MALIPYLAMTAGEILENGAFPQRLALMVSRTGLGEIPGWIPSGGILLLTDAQPPQPDDFELLKRLAREGRFSMVILDFQVHDREENRVFAARAVSELDSPVCVTAEYARTLDCPVLLPPVPLDVPVEEYLAPWKGREIWLEAALDGMTVTVDEKGAHAEVRMRGQPAEGEREEAQLCCHYSMTLGENAVFSLRRTEEDLRRLLEKAEAYGAAGAVGLYQELAGFRE